MNSWLERLQRVNAHDAPLANGERRMPQGSTTPPADVTAGDSCPACGSLERWQIPGDGSFCRPCLIRGDLSILAVKVWADHLNEALWVVVDDLPPPEWPQDAPVYTQAEVKLLLQVSPDALFWVHAVKALLGAQVVAKGPIAPEGATGNGRLP